MSCLRAEDAFGLELAAAPLHPLEGSASASVGITGERGREAEPDMLRCSEPGPRHIRVISSADSALSGTAASSEESSLRIAQVDTHLDDPELIIEIRRYGAANVCVWACLVC